MGIYKIFVFGERSMMMASWVMPSSIALLQEEEVDGKYYTWGVRGPQNHS